MQQLRYKFNHELILVDKSYMTDGFKYIIKNWSVHSQQLFIQTKLAHVYSF